jgi:hypothetical protein
LLYLPSWVFGPLMKLVDWFFPERPRVRLKIRQVCFDRVLSSLTEDFSDYTFDLYFFLDVWAVNEKRAPTTVQDWELTISGNGQEIRSERIPDISKWHQHIKVREVQHGFPVIRDIRNHLDAFAAVPLQYGLAVEGWLCFVALGIRETLLRSPTIKLTLLDSFGRRHSVRSRGPWPCRGDMVNPEMPW